MQPNASTEVAPERAWYKSSYSSGAEGNCVEVAPLTGLVGIRDSKCKAQPAILVSAAAWSSFVHLVSAPEGDTVK